MKPSVYSALAAAALVVQAALTVSGYAGAGVLAALAGVVLAGIGYRKARTLARVADRHAALAA